MRFEELCLFKPHSTYGHQNVGTTHAHGRMCGGSEQLHTRHQTPHKPHTGTTAEFLSKGQEDHLAVVAQLVHFVENEVVALVMLAQARRCVNFGQKRPNIVSKET